MKGDRLVIVRQPETKLGTDDAFFSVDEINDYRQKAGTFSKLVEYHNMTFTLYGRNEAFRVRTGIVSADFFNVFGVQPLLGRTFVAEDDVPSAEPVLVLSYEFWQTLESGDPNIIGKKYEMNDRMHTVIGVLPQIPQYPNENDVYMPTTSCPMRANPQMMAGRDSRMMRVFARLKENETLERANAELKQLTTQFQKAYPEAYRENSGFTTVASLLREDLTSRARPLLLLLWGAATFVLLIACANVANLIMARMVSREHELMLRAAVGAGKGRLLRQLLTESSFLAIFASIVGLIFAFGSVELLKDFTSQITPRAREIAIDKGVLIFTILCAGITTIFFGSVAALYFRQDLASGLKEGGRTGTEGGRNVIRKLLIAAQIAFSFILLVGAGLMVRSFIHLMKVHPGFIPERVYAVRVDLNVDEFSTPEKRIGLGMRLQERLERIPGVVSSAISSSFPLDQENILGGRPIRFRVEGDPRTESECPPITTARTATPDYFETLGIPLIAGRYFQETDDLDSTPVVLLNQTLAVRHWGKENPVGKRITLNNGEDWLTIAGIVGNVKEFGLGLDTPYQIYRPFAQTSRMGSLLLRTALQSDAMPEHIRKALREVEPRMAVVKITTMEQAKTDSVASPRTLTRLFFVFGCIALIIAIAGIGSVLSLWVRQRIRETGIRMALGATPQRILSGFLNQGMALAIAGLAFGWAGALVVSRLLAMLLFRVRPTDPITYITVSVLLMIGAAVACYMPAKRASKIDPQAALHCE